jgi:acyl-CoA thioester hydrolase
MTRHIARVPLRWADMDSYGHVNNAVYLRYLQEARVDMLFVHAPRRGAATFHAGSVVARHEIDYIQPLRHRDLPVRVEVWVREVRNSSFTLGYEVLDDAANDDAANDNAGRRAVYATATTTLVPYDLEKGRPRRLTADEKAVLEHYSETDGPATRSAGRVLPRLDADTKSHVFECPVRFDDFDSYGHVNNVIFVQYLEESRFDFARKYLLGLVDSHQGSVVAGQAIEYLAPIAFRTQPLRVAVWVTRIGESSFDVAYEVRDDERTYARAVSAMVAYDVAVQRTRKLTADERSALEPFAEVGQ